MKWYFIILMIFLLFIFIIGAIKSRWKRRHNGEKISIKKIWKLFWKGVDGVTARQIAISQLLSSWILITGFLFGFVTALFLVFQWQPKGAIEFIVTRPVWFLIVISASFSLGILQLISSLQKYKRVKKVDEQMDWLNNKDLMKKVYEEIESGKSFKQIKFEMKIKIKKLKRYYNKYLEQIKIEELNKKEVKQ